jgi:hypothetical protein
MSFQFKLDSVGLTKAPISCGPFAKNWLCSHSRQDYKWETRADHGVTRGPALAVGVFVRKGHVVSISDRLDRRGLL